MHGDRVFCSSDYLIFICYLCASPYPAAGKALFTSILGSLDIADFYPMLQGFCEKTD
tara:strand:- start:526 stop:696 length:171 start_codon:yes stop_codon:yes gene_type:complete